MMWLVVGLVVLALSQCLLFAYCSLLRSRLDLVDETTTDLYAEIEATDEWLGLEPDAPVNSLADELRDATAPLERRIAALEPQPATPLEPWETWLRETKVRQYNRAAKACGCFECVAFGHSGPCTNPKPDDFRFAEVDDFGSETQS
jgi:hypothetical protein